MRRNDTTKMAVAELAICEAMRQVEGMGADKRLTRAMGMLQNAREEVGNFIDKIDTPEPKPPEVKK